MAYTPTLADINEVAPSSASRNGSQPVQSYAPTLADIPSSISNVGAGAPTGGFTSDLANTLRGIANIPSDVYHTTVGAAKEAVQRPGDALTDALQSVRAYGQNTLAPLGIKGIKTLAPILTGGATDPLTQQISSSQIPSYKQDRPESDVSRATKFLLSAAPFGRAAKAGEMTVEELAKLLPQFTGKKLATAVAKGSAGAAVGAPVVGATPGQGALTGALLPAIGSPLNVLAKGARRVVGGTVSPEEFAQARATVPEGVKAPIGELADSDRAKQAYGISSAIFGSGAAKPYQQISDVLDQGQKDITDVGPANVPDPNQHVYDQMSNAYESAKDTTHSAYDALSNSADAANAEFDNTQLKNAIDKHVDGLKAKMTTKAAKDLYGPSVEILNDFKNSKFPSFKSATDQLPVINDLIDNAARSDNKSAVRDLMVVKKGLLDSLEESSKKDPKLMSLYDTARKARVEQGTYEKLNKKDETPFYSIYKKNGDPGQMIDKYIKPSKNSKENSALLESITSKIPQSARDVMASAHLESDTLPQFLKKLDSLSKRQRKALLGDNSQKAQNMLDIAKVFPAAKNPGFIPQTGISGARGLQAALAAIGAFGSLLHGSPETALISAASGPALGQGIQRALRSETLKDLYARGLKPSSSASSGRTATLLRNLALQGSNQ
ncbi:MAG: hypothetical protein ACPG47_00125 [Leucothrix sp.]